jgi:hypothetical protein
MKKQLNNPFKNTRLKSFFFFLLLATFFWILTKFSKQYVATTIAAINYVNVPEFELITDDSPRQIAFDMSTSGFEFLYFNLKRPSIDIDLMRYYNSGDKEVIIPKTDLINLISSSFKTNLVVRNLSMEKLIVKLDEIITKKVPVIPKVDFVFKDGFKALDSVRTIPDSVSVAGPSVSLEAINFVETLSVSDKNIDKSVFIKTGLRSFDNLKTSVKPAEVIVSLEVAEFSQKEMTIPIEVINIPEDTVVKLIPNFVTLSFSVPVNDFLGITENDFKIVCDYSERNSEENYMIPIILESPKEVINIEFDLKKVDYLIFK